MITNGVFYGDLGGDYYTRLNPEKTKQRCTTGARPVEPSTSIAPPECLVDGSFGLLLGRWHQVCIDTQRGPRVGVPEVLGEGAYRLAGVEQHAGAAAEN